MFTAMDLAVEELAPPFLKSRITLFALNCSDIPMKKIFIV
jgi:hypothetical protein